MTTLHARVASAPTHRLAEGPAWDADRGRALWVDIDAGDVFTGVLDGDRIRVTGRLHVDVTVGAVVPAMDGRLLVAGRRATFVAYPDGTIRPGHAVLPDGAGRRLNDGGVDPAGRFCVGSLSLGTDSGAEVLCRCEDDGSVTTLDADLHMSNGLAWSPDGRLMYSVDTVPGVVWVRDYDAATGAVGPRREHLRLDGSPDGICSDAHGHLWVAMWGDGEVRCYAADGRVLHTIEVPAPHTTAAAFVGPDLDTLLITTAAAGLDGERLATNPLSGALFTVPIGAEIGVRGVPTSPWNGLLPLPRTPDDPEV